MMAQTTAPPKRSPQRPFRRAQPAAPEPQVLEAQLHERRELAAQLTAAGVKARLNVGPASIFIELDRESAEHEFAVIGGVLLHRHWKLDGRLPQSVAGQPSHSVVHARHPATKAEVALILRLGLPQVTQ